MRPIDRPLIKACQNSDALTVEQLLRRVANPNARANEWPYRTALLIATEYGHIKTITTLIQHGADPYAIDIENKNAIYYAVAKRHYDIVKYFVNQLQLNPNTPKTHVDNAFLLASYNGDIEILQLFVQHGANPHATDPQGQTALHYAVENLRYEAVEYLITQLQLDPNTQDRSRIAPS